MADSSINQQTVRRILDLIDSEIENDGCKKKISVLPLMCGVGKSSAISLKIKEVIEKLSSNGTGDGMLIATDIVSRMYDYLRPIDNEIKEFLDAHKEQICIMEHDTFNETIESMYNCPILVMTTQRYFSLTAKEINASYLKWQGGRRTVVVIDEQPALKRFCEIGKTEINDIDSAIYYALRMNEKNLGSGVIETCLSHWSILKFDALKIIEQATGSSKVYSVRHNTGSDEIKLDEIKTKYSPSYKTGSKNQFIASRKNEEDFWHVIDRTKKEITNYRLTGQDVETLCNLWVLWCALRLGGLYVTLPKFKKKPSRTCFLGIFNNIDLLTKIDAKTLILDGTASEDLPIYSSYGNDSPFHFVKSCSEFDRDLSNLTIHIYDEASGKIEMSSQERCKELIELVQKQCLDRRKTSENFAVFTYKDYEDEFKKKFGIENVEHFGNLRGKNDFVKATKIVQVGLHDLPEYMYLLLTDDRAIPYTNLNRLSDEEYESLIAERSKSKTIFETANVFFNSKEEETGMDRIRNAMLLADTEQNIMRGAIRSAANDKKCEFYLFTSFRQNMSFIKLLQKRFEQLKASVVLHKKSEEDQIRKKDERKSSRSGRDQTYRNKFFAWYNKLQPGTEYTKDDLMKVLNIQTGRISDHIKDKDVRDILKNDSVGTRLGRYHKPIDVE